MPGEDGIGLVGPVEFDAGELAHRQRRAESGGAATNGALEQVGVDQSSQPRQHLTDRLAARDCAGGVNRERAVEDREPAEQGPVAGLE